MRAAATVVDAAHWPAVSTALFEEHVDELPLPGDKTDDGENESPTAAMEVNNEDNESVQSKTAAPAPAEHEAQLQQDQRKAKTLLAELAAKALSPPPVEATTELAPAEPAFDVVAATKAAKKLTVVKLRKALEATGADTKGLKAALVERLVDVEWATAVVEHATAMAATRSQTEPVRDAELVPPAPPAPPAAETLAPQTSAQRDTMLSSVTQRSPPDETLLQSLSPLHRIQNASRQAQGGSLDQRQYVVLFRAERQRTESLKDELKQAKDLNERLTAWGRKLRKITKDSRSKTIDAEARLRRLIVGMNNAQMVSKERVRIRALEKNLGKVTRMYSMEKERLLEEKESRKGVTELLNTMEAPIRKLDPSSLLTVEVDGQLVEPKGQSGRLATLVTYYIKFINEVHDNLKETQKKWEEATATIAERDERVASLEKQLAEAHANVSKLQRELAETSKDRDRALADAQKLYAFRLQQAARRARERAAQARDDANQQGPSPPSA